MFSIGIPFYGLAILLALISNIVVVVYLASKYKYSNRELICLLLYETVGVIFGAKLFSFITNYREYDGRFDLLTTGMSSYGAIIGGLAMIILFCLQYKKSIREIMYIFTPSFPLMYSIGKIGCFLAGCCYGIPYNGILSVRYHYSAEAPKDVNLFPVQIIETIIFFFIFVYMMWLHKKEKFNLKSVGMGFIVCGLAKFLLDYLRSAHTGTLSVNQIVSIMFAVIGLACVINKEENKV